MKVFMCSTVLTSSTLSVQTVELSMLFFSSFIVRLVLVANRRSDEHCMNV